MSAALVAGMTRLGWRARVGLLVPADNAVIEPEVYSLPIPGVTFHTARLCPGDAERMWADAVRGATALGELGVDALVYCCAETSADVSNPNRARALRRLAEFGGVPSATTATGAMLGAARETNARRVCVVTPYRPEAGQQFEAALSAAGLEVVAAVHRDFRLEGSDPREWFMTNRQTTEEVYDMVRRVDRAEADTVLVAGTNLPFLSMIEQAEHELGKTVIGCNQSIVHSCLIGLGVRDEVPGAGSLLRRVA